MRSLAVGAFIALALAGAADAQQTRECKQTLDGGWRCVGSDGHVTERRPGADGEMRTTSTDAARWGTSDGHGRGITPPDSVIRNSPTMRAQVWGRVSEPWERRESPARAKGGWSR